MKKNFLYTTIIYSAVSFLFPVSNFILLPVFTKYFDEAQYGVFSILNNLNILCSLVSGLGVASAVAAFYSSFNEDKEQLHKYIGNLLTFCLYFNAALMLLFTCIGSFAFKLIFKEQIDFFPSGFLTLAYGLLSNTTLIYLYFARLDKRVTLFTVLSIIQFLLLAIGQYAIIVFAKKGLNGVFLIRVYVSLAFLILILFLHKGYVFRKLEFKKFITPSLIFSINIIPAALLHWVTIYGDRFFIERYIDLKSLGIYSLLASICSISDLIIIAVGSALQVFIFDDYKIGNITRVNMLYRLFIVITVIGSSFLILAGSNLDLMITNKGFLSIVQYLPVMMIGFLFSAIGYLFNFQITYSQQSQYFIRSGVIVLIMNVIFTLLFIRTFGLWGAVVSSALTKIVMSLCFYFYGQKTFRLNVDNSNFVMFIIFVVVILFFWSLSITGLLSFKLSSLFQLLACIVAAALFNIPLIKQHYEEIKNYLFNRNAA